MESHAQLTAASLAPAVIAFCRSILTRWTGHLAASSSSSSSDEAESKSKSATGIGEDVQLAPPLVLACVNSLRIVAVTRAQLLDDHFGALIGDCLELVDVSLKTEVPVGAAAAAATTAESKDAGDSAGPAAARDAIAVACMELVYHLVSPH